MRTIVICLAIVTLAPALIAEGWAMVQEWDFARRSRLGPGKPMSEARWWPFETSHIGTDGNGSYYGGD